MKLCAVAYKKKDEQLFCLCKDVKTFPSSAKQAILLKHVKLSLLYNNGLFFSLAALHKQLFTQYGTGTFIYFFF